MELIIGISNQLPVLYASVQGSSLAAAEAAPPAIGLGEP